MTTFQDMNIQCAECGTSFIWDAAEQAYYQKKGFKNAPTKCRACRAKKKVELEIEKSKEKEVACSSCGKKGTLTVDLDEAEELFCFDCHVKQLASPAPVTQEED